MERQLALIEVDPDWKIDEQTKQIGREGLARARQALREARRTAHEQAAGRSTAA